MDGIEQTTRHQPFIQGEKIYLRGLRREDMEAYRRWVDNSEVTHLMEMGWRPMSDKEQEDIYRQSTEASDAVAFTITDKASCRAVGCCGLYAIQWICRRADYRILIGEPDVWDKGLGEEAARLTVAYGFDKLNLETIYLGVNCENKRAIRSYEKAGFVREGVRRKLIYRNGRYYDALMMSILREEYMSAKSAAS